MSGKRKPVITHLVDHDEQDQLLAVVVSPYETNVSSPESSSSGPVYAPRLPGFEHHAHHQAEVQQDIGRKKRSPEVREAKTKKFPVEPVPLKHRPRRDPLPMKLRALPQSFWQQPNQAASVSPGTLYPVLPPLAMPRDSGESPEEGDTGEEEAHCSPANTELLFSLFRGVEQATEPPRPPLVRRGRPRKAPSTLMARVLRDDDPCLASTISEHSMHSMLPSIPSRTATRGLYQQHVLAMVPLRDGDRTLTLPSLDVDHNYSQILSELVIRL